jgi:polyketide cyclase/dehydrase/lipid transport protein
MLEGKGATHTRVVDSAAFAYLVDPRNAGEWFAPVSIERQDAGPLHAGFAWRFAQATRRAPMPVKLAIYAPPARFAWETQLPSSRTNIVWTVECARAPGGGTTLRMTTRWVPGIFGWPAVLAAALVRRGALTGRTQRTVERARDAVEAAYPSAAPIRPPDRPGLSRDRRKRH